MKKVAVLLLTLVIGVMICACAKRGDSMILDDDRTIANKKLAEVLTAVQKQDKDALTVLFSADSLKDAEMFDAQMDELFTYFEGELESYNDWGGPVVETAREGFQVHEAMESNYDVKTTKGSYRIAIRTITKDSWDANNVGIQSLYIIKLEDDPLPQYAYWGDGEFTPGINIGIPNAE